MQLWRSKFSAFMSLAQMQYCSKLISVPLSVFHRMSDSIGDPKGELLFIFNTGRCGSTLVTKVIVNFVVSHVFSENHFYRFITKFERRNRNHIRTGNMTKIVNFENSRWRTVAILRMFFSTVVRVCRETRDFDEFGMPAQILISRIVT